MAQYQLVHFNLNGKDVERMVDVRASLTDMLRNDYHMTSVKKGCEVGECGACNVIIDGECFNSCIYLAVWAEGKRIRTLESLMGPNGELSDIQQAFIDETAVQCGFCTPGFIMTAVEILESGKLGEIRAVTAQYGYTTARETRKFDPALAGGTLLDIGVYAIGFACMMMGYAFDDVRSELVMNSAGTDALDAITLRKGKTIAQLTTAIGVNMPTFAAVYGTKGHIDIPEFKNPTRAVLHLDGQEPVELAHPFEINGFEYEIREAQACAEAGSLQSERMTGQQTIAVMRIMDEIRRQNGFRFPFERKE